MVRVIGKEAGSSATDLRWPEESVVLEALSESIGHGQIEKVLKATGRKEQRVRRLPAAAVVWLVISLGIWSEANVPSIWRRLRGTYRVLLGALENERLPVKSAYSEARERLGAVPLRRLFREQARPLATERTVGAFYHGLRMKIIDGVHLDIPDLPANVAAFGRAQTTRYGEPVPAAYPQVLAVCLTEAGTHVILDALLKPGRGSERAAARTLLRGVSAGDLLLWDRGFYSYELLAAATGRGTHVLGRVPSNVVLRPIQRLSDGSSLAKVYPDAAHRGRDQDGLLVRVIEYTFQDPARPGHGERHRLVTTLLDERVSSAKVLVCAYHERWEIELANDELKTHQLDRLVHLRSRTPNGIVQEFYGVLLAYNAVRGLMHEAAEAEHVDPRRISFIDSLRIIRDTAAAMRDAPTQYLPRLYRGMLRLIGRCLLPPRENRINPRVVKRKMSKFAKKRAEHYHLPQPGRPFPEAVVMLN